MILFISCSKEPTPIKDPKIEEIKEVLVGNFLVPRTLIYLSEYGPPSAYMTYETSEIDCSAKYTYIFDYVKALKVDKNLNVEYTYVCSSPKKVQFEIEEKTYCIIEKVDNIIVKKYVMSVVDNKVTLRSELLRDEDFIPPVAPRGYVLEMVKQL